MCTCDCVCVQHARLLPTLGVSIPVCVYVYVSVYTSIKGLAKVCFIPECVCVCVSIYMYFHAHVCMYTYIHARVVSLVASA